MGEVRREVAASFSMRRGAVSAGVAATALLRMVRPLGTDVHFEADRQAAGSQRESKEPDHPTRTHQPRRRTTGRRRPLQRSLPGRPNPRRRRPLPGTLTWSEGEHQGRGAVYLSSVLLTLTRWRCPTAAPPRYESSAPAPQKPPTRTHRTSGATRLRGHSDLGHRAQEGVPCGASVKALRPSTASLRC